MPTKRIKRERETLPAQYPAQFSVMVTPEVDATVRTIRRHRRWTLSRIMREAVDIGLAVMVERGDTKPPVRARATRNQTAKSLPPRPARRATAASKNRGSNA